jgi:large subunit ribosomal protein L2
MPVRKHKPTSPGRRFATWADNREVTRSEPEKALTEGISKSGGRNSKGRVTSRHRGGGAKRRYRKIDFKRRKDGVGATVMSGERADIQAGNCLPLRNIPTGTTIHNVELTPGRGGQLGRSAGTAIQLVAKEGRWATLRLPSTEMRMVSVDCRASVGALGNAEHELVDLGKAGRSRHRGKRPQTRGVAMNPVDHPHGGGEAHKTPGGHPVTPWGVPTLGYRTRKKKKPSGRFIVRGRRRGKKGKR